MNNIDLEMEGVFCSIEFLDFLKEKIRILTVYDSFIRTPIAEEVKSKSDIGRQNAYYSYLTNDCENNKKDETIIENTTIPTYRVYGQHQFYFNICPFHLNDATKFAFLIDNQVNLYYCLGCGRGGSIFDFVQELYHLHFKETVEVIAGIYAITGTREEDALQLKDIGGRFFIEENLKKIGIPHSLSSLQQQIIQQLTRTYQYESYVNKGKQKYQKLLNRIDTYISTQDSKGLLTEESARQTNFSRYVHNGADESVKRLAKRLGITLSLAQLRVDIFYKKKNIDSILVQKDREGKITEWTSYSDGDVEKLAKEMSTQKHLVKERLKCFYKMDI